jgi:P27 family predicted phage terminase small subunit
MPAGRPTKPTQLKMISGTARADRINKREPIPTGNLVDAPNHLTPDQIEIWKFAIENAPSGLLKRLDTSVLETWVVSYDHYKKLNESVQKEGFVFLSPNGYPITHPNMTQLNKQAMIMLRAANEMGFTPASRSKIVVNEEKVKDDPWARLANEP